MNLSVDVISDVICPWCFIGKRRLEKAIAEKDTQRMRELIKLIEKLSSDTDQVIEDVIQETQKEHE